MVQDSVSDVDGRVLDGEWPSTLGDFPSGNGSAGGDFQFAFSVLPGDVDGDGSVDGRWNGADNLLIVQQIGKVFQDEGFDPRRDIDGDGVTNVFDSLLVRLRHTTALPSGGAPFSLSAA